MRRQKDVNAFLVRRKSEAQMCGAQRDPRTRPGGVKKGQNDAAPREALRDAMLKSGPKIGNLEEKY